MVCFNSSAPLMNTSGTVASAFKNRCVGRAISNCAQKLRSMNLESKSRERERERERALWRLESTSTMPRVRRESATGE
ncbi:hypothetical protein GmHk_15G044901 [Glycine max]|nr:hypothetical protein GmHk_15G044901 [Glycine max]